MKLGSATHNPSLLPNIHNYSRRRRCVCVWLDISLAPEMFHVTTLIHLTSGACGRNHWWFHFRIELLRWMNAIRICNNNNNQKKKNSKKSSKSYLSNANKRLRFRMGRYQRLRSDFIHPGGRCWRPLGPPTSRKSDCVWNRLGRHGQQKNALRVENTEEYRWPINTRAVDAQGYVYVDGVGRPRPGAQDAGHGPVESQQQLP